MTIPSTSVRDAEELPETLQIAELLSELMPEPGLPSRAKPTSPTGEVSPPPWESPSALSFEALEAAPTSGVEPQTGPSTYAVVEKSAPAPAEVPSFTGPVVPPPLPSTSNRAVTGERIPLGDLTVAGFFGIVNWRNDPRQMRHPPMAPRYDSRTSEELRKIPFMQLDAPPVEDASTVAAVLKSFSW